MGGGGRSQAPMEGLFMKRWHKILAGGAAAAGRTAAVMTTSTAPAPTTTGDRGGGIAGGAVVLVVVEGSKKTKGYALEWAVDNVVRPSDTLILLAVLPPASGPATPTTFFAPLLKKFNDTVGAGGKDQSAHEEGGAVVDSEMNTISEACAEMMNELCNGKHINRVHTQVKRMSSSHPGLVADAAEEYKAKWVILEKKLKKESENCLKRLKGNVVVVEHDTPKIMQLMNKPQVGGGGVDDYPFYGNNISPMSTLSAGGNSSSTISPRSTISTVSSTVSGGSSSRPSFVAEEIPQFCLLPTGYQRNRSNGSSQMIGWKTSGVRTSVDSRSGPLQNRRAPSSTETKKAEPKLTWELSRRRNKGSNSNVDVGELCRSEPGFSPVHRVSSVRRAVSLSMKQPPTPPPLCSVCKHAAPEFGQPPRRFSYSELDVATRGFSERNFLSEGGYGPVYRGVLENGQVVAVKKHRSASAQGAAEFCSEVEVLSCAQHRNLVMLVGYCMEEEYWILVYEFACNGSLDKQLYAGDRLEGVMTWKNRQKVAVGAARGLRYLHEDCRVGCIVHRDLRPNNILLTHDFEAMVGDFGLARWQADGQMAEETRIVGTFGYLAPEYTQTGQITEKADVYSFGVVLLELVTGVKAIDLARGASAGQHYLPNWARPLMETNRIFELIDPRLKGNYVPSEVQNMIYASSLCISQDPELRPRMAKVLRILEGDVPTPGEGSPSRMQQQHLQYGLSHPSHFVGPPPPVPRQSSYRLPPPPLIEEEDNEMYFNINQHPAGKSMNRMESTNYHVDTEESESDEDDDDEWYHGGHESRDYKGSYLHGTLAEILFKADRNGNNSNNNSYNDNSVIRFGTHQAKTR